MARTAATDEALERQLQELENYGALNRVFSLVPGWELLENLGAPLSLGKKDRIVYGGANEAAATGLPASAALAGGAFCYLVLSGSLATKVSHGGGEALFYNIHRRGSLVYEAACMLGLQPHSMYLEALEPTEVRRISHNELEAAAEADTRIYKLLLRSTNAKFTSVCNQVRETRDFDAATRMYNLLVTLATTADDDAGDGEWVPIGFRASQQMLADFLGINRITAVKALGRLADLGRVTKKDGVYAVRQNDLLAKYRS